MEIITDIPGYWILLWVITAAAIAWWYYSKVNWLADAPKWKRYLLFALRFMGLSLLGLLIAGIFFPFKEYIKEKPSLIVLLDNSMSMLNYEDSAKVKAEIPLFLNDIKKEFAVNQQVLIYPSEISKKLVEQQLVHFDLKKSNISEWFNAIYNAHYRRNISGVVFISDGNYNQGMHPMEAVAKLKQIPIYTVGVGDTIQKRDLQIAGLNHNKIAFLGNKFPVEVLIASHKVKQDDVSIWIEQEGKKLATVKVNINAEDQPLTKHTFFIASNSIGVQSFSVHIESVSNEYNYENNSKRFYIEILDSRSKILLLADAPHPDIAAIKSVLVQDQNLEVVALTVDNLPANLSDYDLIVWHNPGATATAEQKKQVLDAKKPIWYIIGLATNSRNIQELGLPMVLKSSGKSDETKGSFNQQFNKFEFAERTKSTFQNLPPLTTHFGNLSINTGVDVLFYQQVGTVVKDVPLMFFGDKASNKFGVTFGEGLWRWKFADFQKNKSNVAFNELISKTVQYLAVRSNTNRLRVSFPSELAEDEPIRISASFYNESFEPITSVPIKLTLKDERQSESEWNFVPLNTNYTLDLGTLNAGNYTWKATTIHNGKSFSQSGSMVVKKVELEAADTRANHALLKRIANNANGNFYLFENKNNLMEDLKQRDDIATVSYEKVSFKRPIDFLLLLLFIAGIFGAEWVIRRYSGAY